MVHFLILLSKLEAGLEVYLGSVFDRTEAVSQLEPKQYLTVSVPGLTEKKTFGPVQD